MLLFGLTILPNRENPDAVMTWTPLQRGEHGTTDREGYI
jgi:hypothetical protein